MNRLLALVFLSMAIGWCHSSSLRDHEAWSAYKAKHGKNYSDADEEAFRFGVFLQTDALIREHNGNPDKTYRLSHNGLSDLTDEEKKQKKGIIKPVDGCWHHKRTTTTTNATPTNKPTTQATTTTTAPSDGSSLDLRTTGCIGPIKDQKKCRGCWAFASMCVLEYSHCIQHGNNYTAFAEEQLLDCDIYDKGCNGGWPKNAWQYLEGTAGIDSLSSYPFTSGQSGIEGACKQSSKSPVAQVTGINDITPGEASIIAALNVGPVAVAIYASDTFNLYSSGIYANDLGCLGKHIDHGVTVIGYDVDSATGIEYWIIRNSWGSSWGMGGYIFFQRGADLCSVEGYPMQATTN